MDTAIPARILSITLNPDAGAPLRVEKVDTFGQITPVSGPESSVIRFDVELNVSAEERKRIDSRLRDGEDVQIIVEAVGHEDPLSFPVQRSVERESRSEDYNVIFTVVEGSTVKMLSNKLAV